MPRNYSSLEGKSAHQRKVSPIRFGFKKRSRWENVDFMVLVPERARQWETDPDTGVVKILIPRYGSWPLNWLIQPRLSPEKKYLRVPLESRGSFLWEQMDGKRSIGDLVPEYEARFSEDKEDAPRRLGTFLYNMSANKFITFNNLPK